MLNFFLALSLLAESVNSEPLNFTIDDEFGDEITGIMPIYSPAGEWEQGLTCLTCGGINILEVPLDISQIYQGTWHEATHQFGRLGGQTTITVFFTGSAVYVYHIVLNTVPAVTTLTQLSFVLDGEVVGNYSHTPDDSSDTILYNVPVFVSTGLANAAHTLIICGKGRESLLLFDYVMYTSEDESVQGGGFSSSSSISSSTPGSKSALPSTPTLVSISSDTSTPYLPSTSLLSSSIQNLSVTPSQTSSQSITSTDALQTNTSSLPPTTTSSARQATRQSNHVSTRAIVGATIGSIAALLLVCSLLFWRIRTRNRGQGVHVIALRMHNAYGNELATSVVDDDEEPTELKTDSGLEIKQHLSPILKPLVLLPSRSYLTRSRSASSGAAVTTVDAYGHSPERSPDMRPRDGISARGLRKDIMEIREQLASLRARRGRL